MAGPSTGYFHTPVWTVWPCQDTSRGRPTFTDSSTDVTLAGHAPNESDHLVATRHSSTLNETIAIPVRYQRVRPTGR